MARPVATGALLAVAVAAFLCDGAAAQTQPPPKTVDTANPTILPADKQQKIKDFVRRQDGLKEAEPIQRSEESFTAGMTIPEAVRLTALPEDTITEVPQVTSYRFFLARNGIVVVDPASRRVVQVIP
jgi:hypothetical protein